MVEELNAEVEESSSSGIDKFIIYCGVVGLLLGIISAGGLTYQVLSDIPEQKYDDVRVTNSFDLSFLFGLLVIPVMGGICGVATGLMFAPKSYFESPSGQAMQRFVGVKSVLLARLLCFIFFVLGFAILLFVILAVLTDDFKKPLVD